MGTNLQHVFMTCQHSTDTTNSMKDGERGKQQVSKSKKAVPVQNLPGDPTVVALISTVI